MNPICATSETVATPKAKSKVVFIASLPHSGSTLLGLMLNAHPDMVSVGELKQLARFTGIGEVRRNRCTCRAKTVHECKFWSAVETRVETATGRKLEALNVRDCSNEETFAADTSILFAGVLAASGKRYVVDSSKGVERLALFMANPSLDVFPILLLRDPKGQIHSANMSLLRKSKKKHRCLKKKGYSLIERMRFYVATNRKLYQLIKSVPHAVIAYENLVVQPEETLTELMQSLGLPFHPRQLDWAGQESHVVSGNRLRWSKNSMLRLDEAWRQTLSLPRKLEIDLCTIPGRYPFVKIWPAFGLGWRARETREDALAPPDSS